MIEKHVIEYTEDVWDGVRVTETLTKRATVSVYVNTEYIAKRLGAKAAKSRGGKSQEIGGLVTVTLKDEPLVIGRKNRE